MSALTPSSRGEDSARVRAAIEVWLHAKSGRPRTVEAYRWTIRSFRRALSERGLDLDWPEGEAVALVAQEWAARPSPLHPEKVIAPATHNHRLTIVSSFYHVALRRKLLALPTGYGNPIDLVERRKVQEYGSARPLPAHRVKAGLAAIDVRTLKGARDHAFLTLGLTTGRRLAELWALTLGDIEELGVEGDVTPSGMLITWRNTKGGKEMRDRLSTPATRSLRRWLTLRASTTDGALQLYEAVKDGGVNSLPVWISLAHNGTWGKQITPQALAQMCFRRLGTSKVHALRHTFAHAMEEAGAPLTTTQTLLGHENAATTVRYLQRLRSEVNPYGEAVAALYGLEEGEGEGEGEVDA